MTVQDFIVIYNQTFIYMHEKHGKSAVVDLWRMLSKEFCYKLEKLVEEKGIDGYLEFFYGAEGTATREHVDGEASYSKEEGYYERVDHCPSVQSLIDRNKKIYRYYCEHCYWLYAYSLEKHGYHYDGTYLLQEDGKPVVSCSFTAR